MAPYPVPQPPDGNPVIVQVKPLAFEMGKEKTKNYALNIKWTVSVVLLRFWTLNIQQFKQFLFCSFYGWIYFEINLTLCILLVYNDSGSVQTLCLMQWWWSSWLAELEVQDLIPGLPLRFQRLVISCLQVTVMAEILLNWCKSSKQPTSQTLCTMCSLFIGKWPECGFHTKNTKCSIFTLFQFLCYLFDLI